MSRYNVLYLASELYPFAKVGGLADVAGSLPKVLKEEEHDVRVFIPKYKIIRDRKYNLREVIRLRDIEVPLGDETITVSVKSGFVPDSKVQAYFLEYKPFFDRKDVYIDPNTGEGFKDDAPRFALFARAALETLKVLFWQPDLIHVNDWPSALLPYFLKTEYNNEEFFQNIRTILTIHNVAYQGIFPADVAKQIFGSKVTFDENHPAYYHGDVNFLKAGIETADTITTVSPTYAKQIVESEKWGVGLDKVLASRKDDFYGILNGMDNQLWDPSTDPHIAEKYSITDLSGKQECVKALREEMGLTGETDKMTIGMVSRLDTQKGHELIASAIEKLLELPVDFIFLGTGQKEIEEKLAKLAEDYPDRVATKIGFDNPLAHRIEAGSDTFLMPSIHEPCGMNQMYSLRYGTPPIVHATGGLADTVKEFDPKAKSGNGFRFDEYTEEGLVSAVKKAVEVFQDKDVWKTLVKNGLKEDLSWSASAKKLAEIYGKTAVSSK